jgi:hypothetical protein
MTKWIIAGVVVVLIGIGLFFVLRPDAEAPSAGGAAGDPEERIIAYLRENVRPGQAVLVTELFNDVFTRPEEQQALQRLYDAFFLIPATAVRMQQETGKIPTLEELSNRFQFKVPDTLSVMLRVMEADPRMPRFFERDPATGEITGIEVERITFDERFGKPLRGSGR